MGVQSKLERIGFESRAKQSNEYDKNKDYTEMYQEVLKNSELKQKATQFREEAHPETHMELEEPYAGTGYNLSQVKKGNPNDGGHTHTIPMDTLSPNHYIHQLDIFEGGDENDVAARDRLLSINKYSRVKEYNASSIDTTENIINGQYFIP